MALTMLAEFEFSFLFLLYDDQLYLIFVRAGVVFESLNF
jgi:hypothetical protein